jgi:hypothetical protein
MCGGNLIYDGMMDGWHGMGGCVLAWLGCVFIVPENEFFVILKSLCFYCLW